MQIKTLKEFEKLVTICRKKGILVLKVDNVEFQLGPEPKSNKPTVDLEAFPEASIKVPTPNINEIVVDYADKIATDELTEDQLLYYSARPEPV